MNLVCQVAVVYKQLTPWATSVLAYLAAILALEDGEALVLITHHPTSELDVGKLRKISFIECILSGFTLLDDDHPPTTHHPPITHA